jgi:DNA-directed RNA polymerase subunit RPC12/RpoP
MATQLGKRYKCIKCGTEILCTKAGEGEIACCDTKMEELKLRPLPSSD